MAISPIQNMETLSYLSPFVPNQINVDDFFCDFCTLNFRTRAERNVHVMGHFKKKSCSDCNKILIQIADDWYEIHTDSNCNKVKCEIGIECELVENTEQIIIKPEQNMVESSELQANIDILPMLHINVSSVPCKEETIVKTLLLNETLKEKNQYLKMDEMKNIIIAPKRTKKKPARIRCRICDAYISKGKLLGHLQAVHFPKIIIPKDPVKCDTCGRSFSKVGNLNAHQYIHAETKRFVCSYCGRSFSQKYHLIQHTNLHTGEKPHNCKVCNKKFARDTVLRAHMRVHTGEKPFKCPIDGCERAYSHTSDLKRHKYGVHGIYTKKHICPICSKVYSENKLLKKHLESHSA